MSIATSCKSGTHHTPDNFVRAHTSEAVRRHTPLGGFIRIGGASHLDKGEYRRCDRDRHGRLAILHRMGFQPTFLVAAARMPMRSMQA
jgi:hypothetical protein